MSKHRQLEHPGEEVTFKMKVLAKHNSAFERQVTEAVLIEVAEEGRLLNSKGGFNRCVLPRLQVAMGDKVVEHGEKNKERSDPDCDGGKKTQEFTDNLEEGMKHRKYQNVCKRRKGARTSESSNQFLRKIQKAQKMKNQISAQYNFVPLSKVFDVIDKKPRPGLGSNDRESKNQDKRKPGER